MSCSYPSPPKKPTPQSYSCVLPLPPKSPPLPPLLRGVPKVHQLIIPMQPLLGLGGAPLETVIQGIAHLKHTTDHGYNGQVWGGGGGMFLLLIMHS